MKRILLALAVAALLVPAAPAGAAEPTCEEILVPLSDGTKLHGWVRHGTAEGKRPVLWTMTPYTNTGCRGPDSIVDADIVDRMSFASISYRGTGASEGEQDAWGPGDAKDVREVGDWLAKQPWSDGPRAHGRVGGGRVDHVRAPPSGGGRGAVGDVVCRRLPRLRALRWLARGWRGHPHRRRDAGLPPGHARPGAQRDGLESAAAGAARGHGDNGLPAFTEDTNGEFWDSRLGPRVPRPDARAGDVHHRPLRLRPARHVPGLRAGAPRAPGPRVPVDRARPQQPPGGAPGGQRTALADPAADRGVPAPPRLERRQSFKLDIAIDIDLTKASQSDKLADTVGYDQVVEVASKAFCATRYRLVEAAAGAVAEAVLISFPAVTAVQVTVHKPHAPIAATFDDVGVTIMRARPRRPPWLTR